MSLTINSEVSSLGVKNDSNIFTFEPFANKERLAEEMHIAMFCDLAEEGNSSSGNGQEVVWDAAQGSSRSSVVAHVAY